jgi:hypothetical protein
MPQSKSLWDKDLNQATFWIDGQDFLIGLSQNGSISWDGPALSVIIRPTEGHQYRNVEWLEAMRDTFRDAARAAREIADAKA